MPVLNWTRRSPLPIESLTDAAPPRDMLQAMQQSAVPAPSSNSPSFAGLLAALAAPNQQRDPTWNDDGLADDYATLSYERALRTHARYRSAEDLASTSDASVTQPPNRGPIRNREVFPAASAASAATRPAASPTADLPQENNAGLPITLDRNLKSASITIRLSEAESAQLRKRATEAGLTVSAYLRSCTFEAESLRALVKDTLAQLRSEPSRAGGSATSRTAAKAAAGPIRRSWRQLWARFWPRAQAAQGAARA